MWHRAGFENEDNTCFRRLCRLCRLAAFAAFAAAFVAAGAAATAVTAVTALSLRVQRIWDSIGMGIDIRGLELRLGLALGHGEPRGVGREHWQDFYKMFSMIDNGKAGVNDFVPYVRRDVGCPTRRLR